LLRYWKSWTVAETAAVMGCLSGSVQTIALAQHTLCGGLKSKGDLSYEEQQITSESKQLLNRGLDLDADKLAR